MRSLVSGVISALFLVDVRPEWIYCFGLDYSLGVTILFLKVGKVSADSLCRATGGKLSRASIEPFVYFSTLRYLGGDSSGSEED